MSSANGSDASQVDAAGQPQVGDSSHDDASQVDSTSANNTSSSSAKPSMTLEQALDELAKVRREAAQHRTKLSAFEKAQADAQAAQMTDLEKAQAKAAEWQQKHDDATRELQETRLASAVERAAARLNIVDPDAAVKLLDWSQVEYDETSGKPTNVDKLLDKLVKDRPWLNGGNGGNQQIGSGARMGNAGRDAQPPSGPMFKTSQLDDFEFYLKNETAIKQAMREGRIVKDN